MAVVFVFLAVITISGATVTHRPDYKWSYELNGWYKFHNTSTSWYNARSICKLENATLFATTKATHKDQILSIMKDNWSREIHIGYLESIESRQYISEQGTSLSVISHTWDDSVAEFQYKCVSQLFTGSLAITHCVNTALPFICFQHSKPPTQGNNTESCGEYSDYEYSAVTGSCYKFHTRGLPWHDALLACNREGALLAVIDSEAEADELTLLYKRNPKTTFIDTIDRGFVYIGFYRLNQNIITMYGTKVFDSGFNRWFGTQPRNNTYENCGALTHTGLLYMDICSKPTVYICEKKTETIQ